MTQNKVNNAYKNSLCLKDIIFKELRMIKSVDILKLTFLLSPQWSNSVVFKRYIFKRNSILKLFKNVYV